MGILVFLVILFHLFLIFWAFGLFRRLPPDQKRRTESQLQKQPSPKLLKSLENDATVPEPTPPRAQVQDKTISTSNRRVAPGQLPTIKKRRTLPTNRHELNIWRGDFVLQQLRSGGAEVKLPMAITTMRNMNPYAFEELLLTCCKEQGWQIQRNFRYSDDGGVDGRVLIAGKLYLIQAKRYTGHIKPEHIRGFYKVIQQEGVAGGFFIHTGTTGTLSKELLREYKISLISGQRLVNFVAGQRLRILG